MTAERCFGATHPEPCCKLTVADRAPTAHCNYSEPHGSWPRSCVPCALQLQAGARESKALAITDHDDQPADGRQHNYRQQAFEPAV